MVPVDSAEAKRLKEGKMRTLVIALLTCTFALAADSPFVGTWTINKSKSKLDPNGPKIESLSVQIMQDGPTLKSDRCDSLCFNSEGEDY